MSLSVSLALQATQSSTSFRGVLPISLPDAPDLQCGAMTPSCLSSVQLSSRCQFVTIRPSLMVCRPRRNESCDHRLVARKLSGEMTVELQSGQDLMADYPCFRRGKRQVGYSFAENARSDDQTLPSLRTSFRRVQVREALCQRLRANVFSCTRADSSMRVCRNRCTRRADTFNSFRNG